MTILPSMFKGASLLAVFAFFVAAVTACGGGHSPAATPAAPVAADNAPTSASNDVRLATAKRYVAALPSGAVDALYTPEATQSFAGLKDVSGASVIARRYKRLLEPFADLKIAASRIWISGDHAAVEWAAVGIHKRAWMGFPAKKGAVGFPALTILTIGEDGRISQDHTYVDLVTVLTQIGAGPPGAKARAAPVLASTPEVIVAKGGAEENAGVQLSKAMSAALDHGDEAAYLALVTDDISHGNAAVAEPAVGIEKERDHFRRTGAAFKDLNQKVEGWGAQDFALVEWTSSGKNVGPIGPFPAVNKNLTWHGAQVVQVRGGKVAKMSVYFDRVELYSQIGAMKALVE